MNPFKLLCIFFILPAILFGQNIKFKKNQIFLNKISILSLVNNQDDKSFIYQNNKGQNIKINFEFARSVNKIFDSYKIYVSNPNTEIEIENQNITAKTANKASVEVIRFLLIKGIILDNGAFNTNNSDLEKFCNELNARFWIEKSSLDYKVDSNPYSLKIVYLGENQDKEVYRFSQLKEKNQDTKTLDLVKYSKDKEGELSSQIKFDRDTFFIIKVKKLNNGTKTYGLDKVYFDKKGNPVGDKNNGLFYAEMPNKSLKEKEYIDVVTTNAIYKGGEKELYKWVRRNFDANDFIPYIEENTSKLRMKVFFSVSKDGNVEDISVSGTKSEKIKQMVIDKFKRMPKWTPALNGAKKISSSYNLPLTLAFE